MSVYHKVSEFRNLHVTISDLQYKFEIKLAVTGNSEVHEHF
jgi:hypothetical protein